jgi:hypothetical protein
VPGGADRRDLTASSASRPRPSRSVASTRTWSGMALAVGRYRGDAVRRGPTRVDTGVQTDLDFLAKSDVGEHLPKLRVAGSNPCPARRNRRVAAAVGRYPPTGTSSPRRSPPRPRAHPPKGDAGAVQQAVVQVRARVKGP